MTQRVLVTYATRTGSTVGVAEAIGRAIAERHGVVEVCPMQAVTDLSAYDVIVAGSAIQGKAWLPEAMQWVSSHQADLRTKPFAAFLVCLTLAMKSPSQVEKARPMVAEWMAPVRSLVPPLAEGCFPGVLNLSRIPSWKDRMGFQISVWSGVWNEGDHRDWAAIQAWAAALTDRLEVHA
jgi:menaquinone-dependent protoporphyrinogen oxidase